MGAPFGYLRMEPKRREMREKVDATQVANKGIEPGSVGQAIVDDLGIVNEVCFVDFVLGHPAPHQMGESITTLARCNCKQ